MQAIILAAGKSTRTYPLTLTRPKPLLKIMNREVILHNLNSLMGLIDEAIVIIGYKGDMIKECLRDNVFGIKIKHIEQKVQDGNGSAVMLAKELIKDRFIVMVGDDLYSRNDIENCVKQRYCVLGQEAEDLSNFGQVVIDDGKVKAIKEKPGKIKGIANTGLFVLDKKIFDFKLKKSPRGEYEITDLIGMLAKTEKIAYETIKGYWIPITYPWNLLDAQEVLMMDISSKDDGEIEKGAVLKGQVSVGKDTLIKSGAYIEGPVVIGKNCIIGPNCYIRGNTSIGNNCRVGNGVEIKNSIIGDNTYVPHLSYVGDSVIGSNVNVAAGCITANLRHDHGKIGSMVKGKLVKSTRAKFGTIIADGVKLGIRTTIYPGRKIWPNKTTLPGEIVKKDVE